MAKAPRPGNVKTRLLSRLTPEDAAHLHVAFLADTASLVLSLPGVRAAAVCPPADAGELRAFLPAPFTIVPQAGSGLAAGLGFALEHFAGEGHDKILLCDSDSPHVPAGFLSEALALLESVDLVVGPTEDGGYYLVGARRGHRGLFEREAMGTGSALESLLARARLLGLQAATLSPWFDVDLPEDLRRLAGLLAAHPEAAPHTARCLERLGIR